MCLDKALQLVVSHETILPRHLGISAKLYYV
jgi:hypothetical protein